MNAPPSQLGILRPYLNDMVALEGEILAALKKQREDERVRGDEGIASVLDRIHAVTSTHLQTLEEHIAAVGSETGAALKGAVASVTGTVAGIYDLLRKHPMSRMLRDDYTALQLASVSYSMLYTTALALRDLAIANVALRHLQEKRPLLGELHDVIPAVVIRELSEEKAEVDISVLETARKNIREASSSR